MADSKPFSCIICWEKFSGESAVSITNCGHIYHSECIENWIGREPRCPVCSSENPPRTVVYPSFLEIEMLEANALDISIQASLETRMSELEKDIQQIDLLLIEYICRESEITENTN